MPNTPSLFVEWANSFWAIAKLVSGAFHEGKETYGISLRRDVPDALGKQQEAWKGYPLGENEAVAA